MFGKRFLIGGNRSLIFTCSSLACLFCDGVHGGSWESSVKNASATKVTRSTFTASKRWNVFKITRINTVALIQCFPFFKDFNDRVGDQDTREQFQHWFVHALLDAFAVNWGSDVRCAVLMRRRRIKQGTNLLGKVSAMCFLVARGAHRGDCMRGKTDAQP